MAPAGRPGKPAQVVALVRLGDPRLAEPRLRPQEEVDAIGVGAPMHHPEHLQAASASSMPSSSRISRTAVARRDSPSSTCPPGRL
jgi:hypothetical protein